ncbi:MAG: hypothetical protein IJ705_00325 [Oscillospiraceae bacterium]|nr:hypothetical protein [Oscillospiraceae bacterium]
MAEKEKSVHAGHRQRQKQKYLRHGLSNFTDIEAIELLLYYAVPQKDTNGMAHALLERFGSFRGVLEADWQDVVELKGVKENAAILLTLVRELNRRYYSYGRTIGEQLRSVDDVGRYMKKFFCYETEEKVVMLSLDGMGFVLAEHELKEGTPDRVALPYRIIVDFALRDHAARIVLAHNHLDHIAIPSNADIVSTEHLNQALRLIDVELLDHIVIADDDFVSIRESKSHL